MVNLADRPLLPYAPTGAGKPDDDDDDDSPARNAKIQSFLLLNCCVIYIAKFSELI